MLRGPADVRDLVWTMHIEALTAAGRGRSPRGGGWMEANRQSRTLKLLENLGLAYVSVDEPQASRRRAAGFASTTPPVVACTAELAVLRLHGHNAETERFHYLYSEDELRGWVEPVRALAEQADQVRVLMNNCCRTTRSATPASSRRCWRNRTWRLASRGDVLDVALPRQPVQPRLLTGGRRRCRRGFCSAFPEATSTLAGLT